MSEVVQTVHTRIAGVCPVYIWGGNERDDPFYILSHDTDEYRDGTLLNEEGWGGHVTRFSTQEDALAFALSKADWSTTVDGHTAYVMENGEEVHAEDPEDAVVRPFYLGTPTHHWSEVDQGGEHWLLTEEYCPDGYATAEEIKAKYGVSPIATPQDQQLRTLLGRTLATLLDQPTTPPNMRGLILQKIGLYVPEDTDNIKQWVLDHQGDIPPPAHGRFRLGDRVRIVIPGDRYYNGQIGVVRGSEHVSIAVEMEGTSPLPGFCNCGGLVPSRRGLWLDDAHLVLATDQQQQAELPGMPEPPPAPIAPARPAQRTYAVRGSFSETVRGTASYTCTETYSGRLNISDDVMAEILDGVTDRDRMIEAIQEYVRDNNSFGGDGGEDYEYDDHESQDSEGNDDWDFENTESVLDDFLSNHPELDPDRDEDEAADEAALPGGFTVGQAVQITWAGDRTAGLTGIVRGQSHHYPGYLSIEIDEGQTSFDGYGHNCDGLVPNRRGWNVPAENVIARPYQETL